MREPRGLNKFTKRLNSQVSCGVTTDWEGIEKLWSLAFDDSGVDPGSVSLVMTSPVEPKPHREKLAQIMFEVTPLPCSHLSTLHRKVHDLTIVPWRRSMVVRH